LASSYLLAGLPNIKLIDALYFVAAYEFGLTVGIPTVILTRVVYASVNPWGTASSLLITFLIIGDFSYVVTGKLARRFYLMENKDGLIGRSVSLGLVGLFSALLFDLITNFGTGLLVVTGGKSFAGYLWNAWTFGLTTMNFPLPLGIIHEVSDYLFFVSVVPSAILLLKRSGLLSHSSYPGLVNVRDDTFAK
jgi:hypothetical protein